MKELMMNEVTKGSGCKKFHLDFFSCLRTQRYIYDPIWMSYYPDGRRFCKASLRVLLVNPRYIIL